MSNKISYNQFNPQEVTFGNELKDFIKENGVDMDEVDNFMKL